MLDVSNTCAVIITKGTILIWQMSTVLANKGIMPQKQYSTGEKVVHGS